jgi:hypothetical protein
MEILNIGFPSVLVTVVVVVVVVTVDRFRHWRDLKAKNNERAIMASNITSH